MRILEESEKIRRKNRLLQSVIMEFIRTASPVASSTVSRTDEMELSSATIRNLMHELETEGLLMQPHTSAGRMPTDKGYRYYVDYLLSLQEVIDAERAGIEEEYQKRLGEMEAILSRTSYMLAYLSHHAGFVLRPKLESSGLRRMEFIPCDDNHVLLVLVANSGLVRYRLARVPGRFSEDDLRGASRWINKHFKDRNLKDLCLGFADEVFDDLKEESDKVKDTLKGFMETVSLMAEEESPDELLLEGTGNVLSSPEISSASGAFRRLTETFEDREKVLSLLRKEIQSIESKTAGKVTVVIGEEGAVSQFKDLSVVAKTFESDGSMVGVLGILGPKRMEYGRMVSLVQAIHGALEKALKGFLPKP
ncbi:MAG: heat-inducible transcription repressor HrcA [Elusimicrobia bacterium]|nr:heat-inducible transcription repressor HrcA [Elusimicrobiota bacterium]